MELNFTEYDNYKDNNLENDYTKYWEQPKTEKKKKVSFNDILTNMNLVVGKNGVLQQMQHQAVEEQPQYLPQPQQYLPQPQQQYITKKQEQYLPQQKEQYNIKKIEENQVPIDPSVKHSFIYNKYFKDYVDAYKPEPEVLVPRSMEEYRQMVYELRLKQEEERKRISEIKSTKLMFTTNKGYENANNGKNPANIRPSKNNLRMMNFR
jgi:hypothetical protein